MFRLGAALLLAMVSLACGEETAPPAAAASPPTSSQPAEAPPQRRPDERPLPAFEGRTLDGELVQISSFIGKRLVLFFYDPRAAEAGPVADAVAEVAAARGDHNFAVVGVARATAPGAARAFATEHGLEFPVIDDAGALIANRLGLRIPVAVLGVDPEGYLAFGIGGGDADAASLRAMTESRLRAELRIPEADGTAPGALLAHPSAPDFTVERAEGGSLSLAALRGRPVVLVFFLSTCPHCHHALAFLKEELPRLPEAGRPALLGVEISGRTAGVKSDLEREGLDFFDVGIDREGSVRERYGIFGGVPVILLIDAEGRIVYRHPAGWLDGRDPQIFRMRLAKLAGAPVPMLLDPKGYTGSDVCGVCHELEHATWEYTAHAGAYDTLVAHAENRNAECVSCHVVGFGQAGGFAFDRPAPQLEGVGCESCHGRGGPHLSPEFVGRGATADYERGCVVCHDTKHSLGFEYASFRPRVSHASIAALSSEARAALLADGRKPRDPLPTRAAYVGSDACRSCHASEFETWSRHPHARALASLEAKQRAQDADCLRCHTTAYGRPGGFPAGAAPAAHADLARVGCESCHGPGGEHVGPEAPKRGTIVSLSDKCDSCVVLQICGGCHDDANDPGFEFEVVDKIERQRHAGGSARREGALLPRPEHVIGRAFALGAAAGEEG